MGLGGVAGLYLANVNVEGMYLLEKKSDPIYWYDIGGEDLSPREERFSPTTIAVNVGYGLVIGTRFRFTPQVGVNAIKLEGNHENLCSAYSASLGARIDYAIANYFGICLAPSYAFSVYKSDNFVRISETLTQLNEYAEGFKLKAGFYLYF